MQSISYGDTSDFDSDNYEDVSDKEVVSNNVIKIRPTAMELVSPNRNSICFTKTLWCEIPEVINSSVLSEYLFKIILYSFRCKIAISEIP